MPRASLLLLMSASIALAGCGGADSDYVPDVEEHERQFGAEQHQPLLAQFGGEYEGPESAYVRAIGQRLAEAAGLADDCTFTLVNTDVVNAFAVPGCYIYLTRGLLGIVNSEAELASVLAHELGHIVADHSERQQRRSLLRQLGVLAVGWATESEVLTRIAGGAAELFTLRYSRTHEHEADDLAIRYLVETGYDPYAAADMLDALGRNERYQTAGGPDVHGLPEWARTHPLTGNRVERVREAAAATGVQPGALPEREAEFMAEVDDLLYGDDPEQGFVRGRGFAHPGMRVAFEVPAGFALTNTPRAVLIDGPEGLQGEFGGGPMPPGDLDEYASGLIAEMLGPQSEPGRASRTVINGVPALVVPAFAQTAEGTVEIAVAAFPGSDGSAYHFILVSPPGQRMPAAIEELIGSFRRLSPAEARQLRPRFIDVVQVEPGQSARDLAERMASDRPLELFRMLNALAEGEDLEPGEPVKIVRQGG